MRPDVAGWSHGVAAKIFRLVSARMVAQVISIGWFLVLARVFDSGELGVLAAGLVAFAAVSVIADLGTTWSIAREVTADTSQAWDLYTEALKLRTAASLAVGSVVIGVAALLVEERVLLAVTLGVAIAIASGASESGMATLRSIGWVRLESFALPAERLAFVAIAGAFVAAGRGANVVLLVYLLTNSVTGAVMFHRLRRDMRPIEPARTARLWTAETRQVGVAFVVLALGPRANALVLVMLASRLEVADYSVAARPVEQFALGLIGFTTTLLPLLRSDALAGEEPGLRIGRMAAAVFVVALPAIVWAMLDPEPIIDAVYGAERYPGAPAVLALVAVVAVTWPLRGLAGMVLVARERARELARLSLVGLGVNLALAIPLVLLRGATGAAVSLLVTDVVTAALLVKRSRLMVASDRARRLAVAGLVGAGAGVMASMLPLGAAATVVALGALVALAMAVDMNRALARVRI